ncbi:MAG: flavin reductase family protein [Micromonosporaceae bacterium]
MTMADLSPDTFKRAASKFPSGVAVVTARHNGYVHGITVNAFSSLSLQPPQVLVCVARLSRLNEFVLQSNAFAVNILASDQQELSGRFARPGREPVTMLDAIGVASYQRSTGSPIIEGVAAFFDCTVVMACESGDHSVFMGDVLAADADADREPLLYFDRKYRQMVSEET